MMSKIQQLIDLGEKATQGEWFRTLNGLNTKSERDEMISYSGDGLRLEITQREAEDNTSFITAAANTRQEVKAMAAENERMREAIERMIEQFEKVLRISDRDHAAWVAAKHAIEKAKELGEKS